MAFINSFLNEMKVKEDKEKISKLVESGEFILMNKDNKVLSFEVSNTSLDRFKIIEVYNNNLLPLLLKSNLDYLQTWLENRAIPTNRNHIEKLLESLGKGSSDRFSLLMENHACSLNDTYWIKELNEINVFNNKDLSWNDVSLYRGFKESLGLVTFFGNTSSLGGRLRSPEVTGQGALSKAWRIIDGKIVLYKRGTEFGVNSGNEPYSELIASKILDLLNINHVKYNIDYWNNILCSTCNLYTNENIGYITMAELLESEYGSRIPWTYDRVCKVLPNNLIQDLNDMMVFDFIIENADRHYNNFGLLVNNDTREIIGFMPIFDNGFSLLTFKTEEELMSGNYTTEEIGTFGILNKYQSLEIIKKAPKRYKNMSKLIMINLDKLVDDRVPFYRMSAMIKLIKERCNMINNL